MASVSLLGSSLNAVVKVLFLVRLTHTTICLTNLFFVSVQYMYDFLDAMITQQTSPEEVCIQLIMLNFNISQLLM